MLVATQSSALVAWLVLETWGSPVVAATDHAFSAELQPLADAGTLAAPRDIGAESSLASSIWARALAVKPAPGGAGVVAGIEAPLCKRFETESVRIALERSSRRPLVQGEAEGGAPHGDWSMWRSDGSRVFPGHFDRGQPEGRWSWWHEGGAMRAEGFFPAGLP